MTLDERTGSTFELPDPDSDEDELLRQFVLLLEFTPQELMINRRGEVSDRQRQGLIKNGVVVGALMIGASTLFVVCYIAMIVLFLSIDVEMQFQELNFFSFVWGIAIYVAAAVVSVAVIRQHSRPEVKTVSGPIMVGMGTKSFKMGHQWFTLHGDNTLQVRKHKTDAKYTLYYFKSVLGTKLLSIERRGE